MTDREKGMLQILEDYKRGLSEKFLTMSPKDRNFYQMRLLRSEMHNIIAAVKKYCDENCKD